MRRSSGAPVGFHHHNPIAASWRYLSKAALADDLEDLVAVGDVVMRHLDVGALVVVVAPVVGSAHHP